MSDIVGRLRRFSTSLDRDAADEIERLREQIMLQTERSDLIVSNRDHWHAKCQRLLERCDGYKGQVEAGAAEIERLRKVIQRIDGINDNPSCFNPDIQAEIDKAGLCRKPS